MARDRVKTELADHLRLAIRSSAAGLTHRLRSHNVADVDVQQVSELETQVKVVFQHVPPRYFVVKVSEKV